MTFLILLGLLSPFIFNIQKSLEVTFGDYSLIGIYAILLIGQAFVFKKTKQKSANYPRPSQSLLLAAILVMVLMHIPLNGFQIPNYSIQYIVSLAILAPLYEELTFRAIPLSHWCKSKINATVTITLISLYFSFIHSWSFEGLLSLKGIQHFIFGLSLSVVYLRFRSLLIIFLLHGFFNFLGMFLK